MNVRLSIERQRDLVSFWDALGMSNFRKNSKQGAKIAILNALIEMGGDEVFSANCLATKSNQYMQIKNPVSAYQAASLIRIMGGAGYIISRQENEGVCRDYRFSDTFLVAKKEYWSE